VTDDLIAAVITSVATAASTTGVAIAALLLNNEGFNLIEKRLDSIEHKLELIEGDIEQIVQLRARRR
jgi:tetrahydromethanopterin S-methyltransferase subunit G